MKTKTSISIIIVIVISFITVIGVEYYLSLHVGNKQTVITPDNSFGWKFPISKFPLTGSNGKLIAYSTLRDPGGIPQGLPVRLQIPVIGVDSVIEDALITPDGRMDVPAGSANVAWFSLGPHPGDSGSAVIGGHFGISNGVPWVFYNLDKVKSGDKVYIINDKDQTLAFVVRRIQSFDRNGDSTSVFTSSDGIAHLNLITCEGIWNQVNGTYPQRLVVFTDAIRAEGAVTVNKQAAVVNAPPAAAKATPIPMQVVTPASPITATPKVTGTAAIVPSTMVTNVSIPLQRLVLSAQSLYTTPIDGVITTILLIAIGSIVFKIIRQ